MKTLEQFLDESFDTRPAKIDWYTQFDDNWSGRFDIDGNEYRVNFEIEDDERLEVDFGIRENKSTRFDMTGTGNAPKVLATVMAGIDEYLKSNDDIIQIVFASEADETSRVRLYTRMAKRFGKQKGFNTLHVNNENEGGYKVVRFTLEY